MKQKVVHFSRLAAALCLTLGLWGGLASAQNRGITVKGSVVDADGLPVIGAGVTLQGTTTGVAADVDGNFTLVVPGETSVLEVSALGYVTQTVTPTISEVGDLYYDAERDYLWVLDSNSNKDRPEYLPFTLYLFNGNATQLLATYYIGDFAHWNPEAVCVDRARGCVWVGEDCDSGNPSLLHKITFTGL